MNISSFFGASIWALGIAISALLIPNYSCLAQGQDSPPDEPETAAVAAALGDSTAMVTIPNTNILSGQIINFTAKARTTNLILHTSITIGYDVPWRQVHDLMIDAAKSTENVLPDPEPFVLQTALQDFYIEYEINAYTDKPRQTPATYSELHQNIQDKFNEAGVEIMSPHFRVNRGDDQVK